MALIKGHGTDADKQFKAALKKWLDGEPYTQYRAAMELGISQGQLSGLLKDERSASLGQMEQIAKSINSSVVDMLILGRKLLGEEPAGSETENLYSEQQKKALKAFEKLILNGGEIADHLAETAIKFAEKAEQKERPIRKSA